MEAVTIDLTDPFEKYLKQNNWTAEGLNERLSLLAGTGTNLGDDEQKNITLDELLGHPVKEELQTFDSSNENLKLQSSETIILSDDESEEDFQIQEKSEFNDDERVIDISDDEIDDKNETKNEAYEFDLSELSDHDNEDDLFEELDNRNDSIKTNDKPEIKTDNSLHSDHSQGVLSLDGDIVQSELNVSTKSKSLESIQIQSSNLDPQEITLHQTSLHCSSPKSDTNGLKVTENRSLEECQINSATITESCQFKSDSSPAIIDTQDVNNMEHVHSLEAEDQAERHDVLQKVNFESVSAPGEGATTSKEETLKSETKTVSCEEESGNHALKEYTDHPLTKHTAACETEIKTRMSIAIVDENSKDSLLLELDEFIKDCTPGEESLSASATLNDNKTEMPLEIDDEVVIKNQRSEMEELAQIEKDIPTETEVIKDGIIHDDEKLDKPLKDFKSDQEGTSENTLRDTEPDMSMKIDTEELMANNQRTKIDKNGSDAEIIQNNEELDGFINDCKSGQKCISDNTLNDNKHEMSKEIDNGELITTDQLTGPEKSARIEKDGHKKIEITKNSIIIKDNEENVFKSSFANIEEVRSLIKEVKPVQIKAIVEVQCFNNILPTIEHLSLDSDILNISHSTNINTSESETPDFLASNSLDGSKEVVNSKDNTISTNTDNSLIKLKKSEYTPDNTKDNITEDPILINIVKLESLLDMKLQSENKSKKESQVSPSGSEIQNLSYSLHKPEELTECKEKVLQGNVEIPLLKITDTNKNCNMPTDALEECNEVADSNDDRVINAIDPLCNLSDTVGSPHNSKSETIENATINNVFKSTSSLDVRHPSQIDSQLSLIQNSEKIDAIKFNVLEKQIITDNKNHKCFASDESKEPEVVHVDKLEGVKTCTFLLNDVKEQETNLKEDTFHDISPTPKDILQLVEKPQRLTDSLQQDGCILRASDNVEGTNSTLNISSDDLDISDNKSPDQNEQVYSPQVSIENPTLSSKTSLSEDTDSIQKNSEMAKCSVKEMSKNDKENSRLDASTANDNDSFNVEDIRQQLKLQLSNLRTKRKMNMFQRKPSLLDMDRDETLNHKKTFPRPKHETFLNPSILTENKNTEIDITDPPNVADVEQDSQTNECLPMASEKQNEASAMTGENTIMVDKNAEDDTVPEAFQALRKIINKKKLKDQRNVSMDSKCTKDDSIQSTTNIFPVKQSFFSAKPVTALDIPNHSPEAQTKEFEELNDGNFSSGKKSSKLEENAANPFVSNTLDEFLTDAKLNVSYTIPKCDAEEGLQKDYFAEPVVPYHSELKEEESEKSRKEPKYKPKTLAEKRRILEKKKKTDDRRIKKQQAQEEMQNRSYVLFKNKKVFLRSKMIGKCVAYIQSTVPRPSNLEIPPRTRKPSLLTELHKKETSPVKYRPGPLCRKNILQHDYAQWSSEIKLLPTVILNVMPEMGKPIHPNLLSIVNHWNGEITTDQVEFALSALGNKPEEDLKVFQFNLQYKCRQDSLLVRKRNTDKKGAAPLQRCESPNKNVSELSITEEVQSVINNLLNYVEVKELAPTLSKEDEVRDDGYGNSFSPVKAILGKGHYPRKRVSKINRELIRLSCRVVSMEVKDSTEVENCLKPHCKLGCVCKSLRCESLTNNLHCRKAKCIFGCLCPKERSKIMTISEPTLTASTDLDLLSTDTVTRIEDEAKKNLAKEEKEFTQTIICANDKTFVVGVANKPRRAARAPKKYTDFFAEDDTEDEPVKKKRCIVKPCVVAVENWDFSDIEPYCLVHHLYKCHCKGLVSHRAEDKASFVKHSHPITEHEEWLPKVKQSQVQTKVSLEISKVEGNEAMESTKSRRVRKINKTYSSDFIFYDDGPQKRQEHKDTFKSEENKLLQEVIPDNCARTLPLKKKYRLRKVHDEGASADDFVNNITQAHLFKLNILEPENMTDADVLKKDILDERSRFLDQLESNKKKHQRKQSLEKREEDDKVKATDREKSKIKPVFKGEIIVNDFEWLKKITNKPWTTDCYARILPWPALLTGFTTQSINVYCISDIPLRLMLGVGKKMSNSRIMDIDARGEEVFEAPLRGRTCLITQSQNVRDIIKWLHAGALSSKYKADSLSFLLVETVAGHFEVRGLCSQKTTTSKALRNEKNLGLDDLNVVEDITEIKHKDLNNEIKLIFILKCQFKLRELVEDGFHDDHTDSLYMWVGLPEVYKVAKWRMIFLNQDFAYLFFNKIKYSINYMDLVKLTELAKESQMTLIIRNLAIRRSYAHNMYGIYVSPKYADRIFVGPYFLNHYEEDISTLKYMKETLISSESYSRMVGEGSTKCGHWMHERPYQQKPERCLSETVDLTTEDESEVSTIPKKNQNPETKLQPSTESKCSTAMDALSCSNGQVIYQYGQKVLIKNAKPRAPTEFNRFIITNIPHFGYLGAYQPSKSTKLEVSWPFEKKVLEFENADKARDFLQERFNQLLQPVPESFKIQVIVLLQLDLKESQPINAENLNGHCICGFFGTYNINDISDDFCRRNLNISKEEIGHLFMKRAEVYIAKRIDDLAEVSGIDPKDKMNYNVKSILERARDQIKQQENIRINLSAEIHSRELNVISNIKKVFKMIKDLPDHQRNIESRIINDILRIRPQRLGTNETIVINDDDSTATCSSTANTTAGISSTCNTLPLKTEEPGPSTFTKPENANKYKRKAQFQLKFEPQAKKAKDQIKEQEKIRINLSEQIHSRELQVVSNLKKVFKMVKELPEHQRNTEARIINDIIRIRPQRLGTNNTIVTNDDSTTTSGSNANTLPFKIIKINSLGSGSRTMICQPSATITSQIKSKVIASKK